MDGWGWSESWMEVRRAGGARGLEGWAGLDGGGLGGWGWWRGAGWRGGRDGGLVNQGGWMWMRQDCMGGDDGAGTGGW